MTEEEVSPYIGAPVRVTLADGGILAGTLKLLGSEHGHSHYAVVSDPIREGGPKVEAVVHGASSIVEIDDASDDAVAVE